MIQKARNVVCNKNLTGADGCLAPDLKNHGRTERVDRVLPQSGAFLQNLDINYPENVSFLRGYEAAEHLIHIIGLLGFTDLEYIDIPLQVSIVNFCVSFEIDWKNSNRRGSALTPIICNNEASAAAEEYKLPSEFINYSDLELEPDALAPSSERRT